MIREKVTAVILFILLGQLFALNPICEAFSYVPTTNMDIASKLSKQSANQTPPIDTTKNITQIESALNKYDSVKRWNDFKVAQTNRLVYHGKFILNSTAIGLSIAFPVGAPLFGIANTGLNQGVDALGSTLVNKFQEESQKTLVLGMKKYHQAYKDEAIKMLEDLKKCSGDSCVALFNKKFQDSHFGNIFKSDRFDSMSAAEQGTFLYMLSQNLSTKTTTNEIVTQVLDERISANDKELEKAKNNHQKLSKGLTKYKEKTDGNFAKLTKKTQEINSGIKDLMTNVDKGNTNIKQNQHILLFVEAYLYEQMDPREKLAALDSGAINHLQGEALEVELKKQELLKLRVEFNETMGSVTGTLDDLTIIFDGLDIDPNISKTVATISKAAKAAQGVINSLSTGNYIGAVASVFSFIGSSRDIAAERHQQVMDGISTIIENQEKSMELMKEGFEFLRKGQEMILKNQQTMIDLQKETYNQLIELRNQVYDNYLDLKMELAHIKERLDIIQRTLTDFGMEKFQRCFAFSKFKDETVGSSLRDFFSRHMETRFLNTFKDRNKLFNYLGDMSAPEDFKLCNLALNAIYTASLGSDHIHSILQLETWGAARNADNAYIDFKNQQFLPLYNYYSMWSNQLPFSRPLDHITIAKYAIFVMDLVPFYDLLKSLEPIEFYTKENIQYKQQNIDSKSIRPKDLLKHALYVTDQAIRQEIMLAGGSGIVEQLAKDIEQSESLIEEDFMRIHSALKDNELLVTNLFAYLLKEKLLSRGIGAQHYKNFPIASAKRLFAGTNWSVNDVDETISLKIKNKKEFTVSGKLPEVEYVMQDQLQYRAQIELLLQVRSRLMSELNKIYFWKNLRPEEKVILLQNM